MTVKAILQHPWMRQTREETMLLPFAC